MYKIKAVAFDLTGGALDWLNQFADEDHMDLCEIITLDDDSPIAIADLPMYDNWTFFLCLRMALEIGLNYYWIK